MQTIILDKEFGNKSKYKGLTSVEAESKLKELGYNSLPVAKKKSGLMRLLGIFFEPMMLLILTTAIVYFFIGEKTETIIFLLSIIPIALMEFFQELRTDQAIEALDKLMTTSCEAYRDGEIKALETKLLVPGDLVHLTAGDKIPADGYLFDSPGLRIDESVLTGESIAVAKSQVADINEIKEEYKLWQGTYVTQGEGTMIVEETGANTSYGKLGSLLSNIKKTKTPLQIKLNRFLKIIAVMAIFAAIIVTIVLYFTKGLVSGILGGLTIAMSLIPEEFPIVFSVFLILGVLRMAKRSALVREMTLVETLGSVTVICTDKTGTLTEGRMSIKKVYWHGQLIEINKNTQADLAEFIKITLLALERVPIDPIEIEAHAFAKKIGIKPHDIYEAHRLLDDKPFDANTKMVHHLWQDKNDGSCQYSAGAPEFIIENCNLSGEEKQKILNAYEDASSDGYRVVGIAVKNGTKSIVYNDLEFVGLLIMSDPPRREVKDAVDTCQKAGIRIIMITGDNKMTAHSIAEEINLNHNEEILTGSEIENISPDALKEKIKYCSIFARVKPEQKYTIVKSLQENGEVVAMTGDGVNDAPALKKADIGVAMGKKGTEVARAAAGMVLLDDNFSTIVNAVREGRRIYDNMRQAFVFLLSFHIPIVGLAIIPLFFGDPMIFLPIHIIFLELICDPSSVLGFEREAARHNLMKEKPRSPSEQIINFPLGLQAVLQGLGMLAVSLGFYYYYGIHLNNFELGRTIAFTALVLSQLSILFFSREWVQVKNNKVILVVAALTFIFLSLSVLTFLHKFFHFVQIPTGLYLFIIAVVMVCNFIIDRGASKFKKRYD